MHSNKDAVAREGHESESEDLHDLKKARLVIKDFKNREDDFRETLCSWFLSQGGESALRMSYSSEGMV